jgi:EmrB/QacA subfamily drug resistance transporter
MSKRTLAMIVLVVAQFMDLMDAMITNVALPSIQRDLGASAAELEWTLSAYVLMFAVVLVTGGRLGDIAGRRTVFLVGIAGFTLASLGASVSQTATELVLARGLQGLCAALMVPQVLSTAQALYGPEERGGIFGLMSALGGIGVLTGQLLGGWMVSSDAFGIGWRSVFVINVPVGVLILLLTLMVVPNTRSEHPLSLDVPGFLLATGGTLLLLYPLIEGNTAGWPTYMWVLFAAAAAVLALFVLSQRRKERLGDSPLVPMRLFSDRGFAAGSVVQLANYIGWGSFALMIPLYIQDGLHESPLRAGLTMLPVTVGSFVGTALAGVAARSGRPMVAIGGVVEAAGFAWYAYAIHQAGEHLTLWTLALPLGLTGVGMILLAVPLMSVSLHGVPGGDAGAASGTFTMFQQMGNASGIAVVGVVFFHVLGAHPTSTDYRHAIVTGTTVTVVAFAVAAAAALALPRTTAPAHHGEQEVTPEPARA